MRTLKLLAVLIMAVNFTACNKDDEGETNSGASKRITQIKSTYDSGSYTVSMSYKDNKLNKFIWTYDDEADYYEFNQNITYSNNKVIMMGEIDSNEC